MAASLAAHDPAPDDDQTVQTHAEVLQLIQHKNWRALHRRFTIETTSPVGPWNRCLTLLHGMGAKSCVIENHYVCLDYKSEMLSFYAQLDAPRRVVAARLHFFATAIQVADLTELTKEQKNSYLGYIVVRDGNLPLVGRTTIKAPDYIHVTSAVSENVHFFGQQLEVVGVPFMQQDEKFAVCSQVAVWAAHYSAYRLGLVQRRLVAEIVAMSGTIEPMKPHVSDGLFVEDVARLFRLSGLSARSYNTPEVGDVDLPKINMASVEGAAELVRDIRASLSPKKWANLRDPEQDLAAFAADLSLICGGKRMAKPIRHKSTALLDLVFRYLVEPYLRSRMPVYAGTENHALLICGVGTNRSKTSFFAHDDQYGPYLAMDSILDGSRTSFLDQGYFSASYPDIRTQGASIKGGVMYFPKDVTRVFSSQGSPHSGVDRDRAVHALVIPGPSRLLLTPAQAEDDAFNMFGAELAPASLGLGQDNDGEGLSAVATEAAGTWNVRTSILMGIDYKQLRRAHLLNAEDREGAAAISSLHLAEWVVVVEDVSRPGGQSRWEVVYDGSSSFTTPIIQAGRFGKVFVSDHPLAAGVAETVTLLGHVLPHIVCPTRVGKVNHVREEPHVCPA